ncbi:NAD(P)H-binding protein [Bacillus sp. S10(2024)]|uniref:NAD(P)H-binding protein n=1 Tax=Bacillus sp. S10(2024) TaxID=3162886 RepID=UPI003D1DF4B4
MFRILFPNMMKDKYEELNLLLKSNLNWTFIRLPFVMEGVATGSIKVSLRDIPGLKIYNGDIADFLIKQISSPLYLRKCPFIAI